MPVVLFVTTALDVDELVTVELTNTELLMYALPVVLFVIAAVEMLEVVTTSLLMTPFTMNALLVVLEDTKLDAIVVFVKDPFSIEAWPMYAEPVVDTVMLALETFPLAMYTFANVPV